MGAVADPYLSGNVCKVRAFQEILPSKLVTTGSVSSSVLTSSVLV